MNKYRQNKYETNKQSIHLTPTITNIMNQQKNKEDKRISKLMLPDNISSTLLPIKTETKKKSHQKHVNSILGNISFYRPSLCNGTYGAYCYTRAFCDFQFPPIKTQNKKVANITKFSNLPINFKVPKNGLSTSHFVAKFCKDKKIDINNELCLLLSI
eukprot:40840_1